jgi:short/branched chain acyl-CoA dehydrogenase
MVTRYKDHQEAIRKMVREFAEKEVAPGAAERDRTGEFDYALYRMLGDLGITGIRAPEEHGGSDAGFLAWNLAVEELCRADAAFGLTAFAGSAGISLLWTTSDEQKEMWAEKWLLPMVRAEAVGAGGITEPDAGSDTRGIKTTAVLDGDEWVINGTKTYITNAGLKNCVFVMVVCLTDKEKMEFSNIIVPTGTPGYTIMPKLQKMGIRSSDTRELHFDDCRVPAMNLVGERGLGRSFITRVGFAEARIQCTSVGMGIHQACLDESLKYALERIAFNRPIYAFQYVQGMLVDMYMNMEISRLLRDKAALLVEQGEAPVLEASMAKYFGCEAAKQASDYAVQIHGGLGYMDECPVSRYYRDVRVFTIGDGTTEIQKLIIAREIARLPRTVE